MGIVGVWMRIVRCLIAVKERMEVVGEIGLLFEDLVCGYLSEVAWNMVAGDDDVPSLKTPCSKQNCWNLALNVQLHIS
jgi:hypothetical protein